MTENCGNCKYWTREDEQCVNEDYVRESMKEVSGMGGMMTDIMVDEGIINTFGTPADYHCMNFEGAEK